MLAALTLDRIVNELAWRAESPTDGIGAALAAIVFSGPWGEVLTDVARHGAYLDERTGRNLQVFFAGVLPMAMRPDDIESIRWYDSELTILREVPRGPQSWDLRESLGRDRGWVWSPKGFNELRQEVERAAGGRWHFSGNSEMVLANFLHGPKLEPAIDWESVITRSPSSPSPIGGTAAGLARLLNVSPAPASGTMQWTLTGE